MCYSDSTIQQPCRALNMITEDITLLVCSFLCPCAQSFFLSFFPILLFPLSHARSFVIMSNTLCRPHLVSPLELPGAPQVADRHNEQHCRLSAKVKSDLMSPYLHFFSFSSSSTKKSLCSHRTSNTWSRHVAIYI